MTAGDRSIRLVQQRDYRVAIEWDAMRPPLIADEPPPLGGGEGPSPSQLLLAAVANCMTDSLVFALRKFRLDAEPLSTEASGSIGRNAEGRQRVLSIDVQLRLGRLPDDARALQRVLDQFEQFCIVGGSVAQGIPVNVSVLAPDGARLHGGGGSAA
jgi:uncharacterized OsmC-like protein